MAEGSVAAEACGRACLQRATRGVSPAASSARAVPVANKSRACRVCRRARCRAASCATRTASSEARASFESATLKDAMGVAGAADNSGCSIIRRLSHRPGRAAKKRDLGGGDRGLRHQRPIVSPRILLPAHASIRAAPTEGARHGRERPERQRQRPPRFPYLFRVPRPGDAPGRWGRAALAAAAGSHDGDPRDRGVDASRCARRRAPERRRNSPRVRTVRPVADPARRAARR